MKGYGQAHFVKKLMTGKSSKLLNKMLKMHLKQKNRTALGGWVSMTLCFNLIRLLSTKFFLKIGKFTQFKVNGLAKLTEVGAQQILIKWLKIKLLERLERKLILKPIKVTHFNIKTSYLIQNQNNPNFLITFNFRVMTAGSITHNSG